VPPDREAAHTQRDSPGEPHPACHRGRDRGADAPSAYFLPPYALELNEIEPVFRQVKYQERLQRSHPTRAGLRDAVESGFTTYGRDLKSKSKRPRRAG
jgi:hypothetical protein